MATITYSPALPWLRRTTDSTYGQCLSAVVDLEGGMVSGRLALSQELARRSITANGTNVVDRDYGYDLSQHINGRVQAADLSDAAAQLTTQYRADDRVVDVEVSISYLGGVMIVTATITDGDGPFPLTLSVTEAGAQILKAGV